MVLPFAVHAKHTNQSLGQHTVERRDKVIRLDTHVQETPDHVDHIVRVYRCKYEVTRQRGLNRDLSRLVDGNLRDAVQLVLDRIFDRDDLVFFVSDLVQRRVERGRLARSGWTSDQDHAVRLGDVATKLAQVVFRETNHVQIQVAKLFVDLFFVENTNDRVFTVNRRHDRNAKVDVATLVTNTETTVLRHATLGDVEL